MNRRSIQFAVLCVMVAAMVVFRWVTGASYLGVDLAFSLVFIALAYLYYFRTNGEK